MNIHQDPILFEKQVISFLKETRRRKKITQTELGILIGVSRDTIARIESGRHRVYLAQVIAIARELNVMLQDLIFEDEQNIEMNENVNASLKDVRIFYQTPEPQPAEIEMQVGIPNPYSQESAVELYGESMKEFILNHRLFWHWVPEEKLPGLSLSAIVEATLIQGNSNNIKWLFDTVGVEKVATIFRFQTTSSRHGYPARLVNYFNQYFNRHAPKHTD